jgi:EPS-associated MarR family transcriptional regulator
MLDPSTRYQLLKILENNPKLSQRELAIELGISVGKVNFCLKALIEKGLLKTNNFRNSKNKLAYMYLLTPKGIEEKARITVEYLKWKLQQYEELRQEIEELQREFTTHTKQLTTPAALLAQKPPISKRTVHTNSEDNT